MTDAHQFVKKNVLIWRPSGPGLSIALLFLLGCSEAEKQVVRNRPSEKSAPIVSTSDLPEPESPVQASSRYKEHLDWFSDVTPSAGVRFAYSNGREGKQFTILESVGGGAALFDYDGDGLLDLAFAGGGSISGDSPPLIEGHPTALYRNLGEFRFAKAAASARVNLPGDYSHGCSVVDYDRDGFPDLLITAYGRVRFWHNQGDGTFRDASAESGFDFVGWTTAAAWADVDRDGWADLYLAQYMAWSPDLNKPCIRPGGKTRDVCPPQEYKPAQDRLFLNNRDGSFREVTGAAGLDDRGYGLGVVAADLNADGWIDFYVANDVTSNQLYLGGPALPLREAALTAGLVGDERGIPEGSMGVDLADFNGDGWPDLFVTNFELEDNSLYRGNGAGTFSHASVTAGLTGVCFPYVGFGTCFEDLDGDGWPDLFISNGNVFYHLGKKGYQQPAFLFRNENGRRFSNQSVQGGAYFGAPHVGRGAALGDLNNDGAPDLVVVHQNEPVSILKNQRGPKIWVGLRLRGTNCDSDAIGARVRAAYQGREIVRWVKSGAGYLSQFDNRICLPCEGEAAEVEVTWLGGGTERFARLETGRYHEIVEGQGTAKGR